MVLVQLSQLLWVVRPQGLVLGNAHAILRFITGSAQNIGKTVSAKKVHSTICWIFTEVYEDEIS